MPHDMKRKHPRSARGGLWHPTAAAHGRRIILKTSKSMVNVPARRPSSGSGLVNALSRRSCVVDAVLGVPDLERVDMVCRISAPLTRQRRVCSRTRWTVAQGARTARSCRSWTPLSVASSQRSP